MKIRVIIFRWLVVSVLFIMGFLFLLNIFGGTFFPEVSWLRSLFWSLGMLTVAIGLLVEFYYNHRHKKKGGGPK